MVSKAERKKMRETGLRSGEEDKTVKLGGSEKNKNTSDITTAPVQNINPVAPVQNINPQKSNLEKYRESDTIGGKILNVASSPKTTAVLGGTLAAVTGIGLATGAIGGAASVGTAATAGETASITATSTAINSGKVAGEIVKRGSFVTTQRAFIGKATTSGINKLFHTVRPVATRFATNSKSATLTASWLTKIGKGLVSPTAIMAIVGTYPFAGFIKEEALQTISFASKTAIDNGDIEGAKTAMEEQEAILNPELWNNILNSIPFTNVLNQLKSFYKSASIKLDNDKKTLELLTKGEGNTLWQTQQEEQSKIGITED